MVANRPLYIFHWDTDGIVSAALMKKYVDKDPKLYTPHIGLYTLKYVRRSVCNGVDWISIIDFGVSNDEIRSLMYRCGLKTLIIDHHYREDDEELDIVPYYIDGEPYPSTTLLISDKLGIKYNLLSVLGIVGDFGEKIYDSKYLDLVEDVGRRYNLSVEDLLRIASLIDSNYVAMNRKNVVKAVDIVLKYSEDPVKLLNYPLWIRQCDEAMKEIDRILSMEPKKLNGIYLLEFNSNYFITSVIGRNLAMRYKGSYVIVGRPVLYKGFSQIYVRTYPPKNKELFRNIISYLNKSGFYAGGKGDVFGVILPVNKYRELLEWIINRLRK